MGLFTQVVRTRSLATMSCLFLIHKRALLFLQCACWFYCACNPSALHIYFIIMHLSPFGYNGFVHNLYFFTTCTAGKKELAHRNSEQNALGTHRERIGRAWVELERVRPKNWQRRLFAAGHAEMLQNIGVKSSPGKKERMHAWAHPQHLLCSFFPSL